MSEQPQKSSPEPETTPVQPAAAPASPAWRGWAIFAATLVATFVLGLLAASILFRRQEADAQARGMPAELAETELMDAATWGQYFPREYDSYKKTALADTKTKYGGSYQWDYLALTPANVILFSGYPFAIDYKQARGHQHALEDVKATPRTNEKTFATCLTCKSPDSARLLQPHNLGPEKFYSSKFSEMKSQVTHPVGCYDCHDPKNMKLRVVRPAMLEAFERMGKDITKVSHQEMRSLVCAQCHVEYYFRDKYYLEHPWIADTPDRQGTTVEALEEYYDSPELEFKEDWKHAVSGASMLKMQHPDWELYRTGIHAYRNVSCADCHMPYRTEGGSKFTDHHVQSPLLNIANSCSVCHRWSEEEIRNRVYAIQDKVHEGRGRVEDALAKAHFDIAAAKQAGANDEELKDVRRLVRRAQMRWDYIAANNGMGFHSPQESMRILAAALDLAGQCRVECARILARHGVTQPVNYPDFSTKEKAQEINKAFVEGKGPKLVEEGKK